MSWSTNKQQQYCLKWNNYAASVTSTFKNILDGEDFVDVSLVASKGHALKAHRVVLAACSVYFREILKGLSLWQHPVIVLKDVPFTDLQGIVEFIYHGEVKGLTEEDPPPFRPDEPFLKKEENEVDNTICKEIDDTEDGDIDRLSNPINRSSTPFAYSSLDTDSFSQIINYSKTINSNSLTQKKTCPLTVSNNYLGMHFQDMFVICIEIRAIMFLVNFAIKCFATKILLDVICGDFIRTPRIIKIL
ncbi:unnamed protein product [Lepeophtheirus salmonis]|uniref:(salmon louse) hypothetical protein n=1 Tax=Lepeophtheirus salmonis TaxID=72036 RepID=A0A7R8CKD9_LEPSM|nr:unnamed protein product [Lepeophtheirus salmonis]CAF2819447.1 unnamed protein product [Lepeophtheirus salmonis]